MNRLPFLDATRGVLACVVVMHHVLLCFRSDALAWAAHTAVLIFFLMSGYVLARGYDDRPLAFMARRVVRLWPLYAVCVIFGCVLLQKLPMPGAFVWWPMPPFQGSPDFDPPAWSLYMEAWATLVFPVMFWVVARGRSLGLACAGLSFLFILVDPRLFCVPFFFMGAAATRFDIAWPSRLPRPLVWLGEVSYSLYLTHDLVILAGYHAGGRLGALMMVPVVFVVAWLSYRFIELPSIRLSRWVGGGARRAQPLPVALDAP